MSLCLNRFLQIKQQWTQFGQFATNEKIERSKDIQTLLDELQKKIMSEESFESSKSAAIIIKDQLNRVQALLKDINNNSVDLIAKEKQTIENINKETENKCLITQIDIQNSIQANQRESISQMTKIKRQVEEQNEKCINILDAEKKALIEAKQFIENRLKECHKKQLESIKGLCEKAEDEMCQIYEYIEERRANKKRREEKLKYMSENLLTQLSKVIERQQKQGKITYESLLKLMDDFHWQIKSSCQH